MVGKRAVGEPVPPVADGGRELRLRLVQVGGLAAGPRQRDECALALVQRRASVAAGARRPEAEGRRDGELRVTGRRAAGHDFVAVPLVFPRAGLGPVLEHGHGVDHHFDVALDARGQPQEGAAGGGIAGGTPVVGAPGSRRPRAARPAGPARGATRSGCARSSRAPWSRVCSAAGAARGCSSARTGSCRRCGPGWRRRRWASPAGEGTTTRRSRPEPRGSCSRSPRGTRSRRWAGNSRSDLPQRRRSHLDATESERGVHRLEEVSSCRE